MTAEIKAILTAVAIAVCVALGGSVVWVFTRDTIHRQESAIADLTADNSALTIANKALQAQSATRASRNAATAATTKARNESIDTALTGAAAWGAERVPDGVAAALGVYPSSGTASGTASP